MKRILIPIMILFMFCGCANLNNNNDFSVESENLFEKSSDSEYFIKALWVTVYEIAPQSDDEQAYKKRIDNMMNEISSFGFTDLFVQVRANCDSIYPSEIYMPCNLFEKNEKLIFDALNIICDKAVKYNLKIHAWINPYRMGQTADSMVNRLPEGVKQKDIFEYNNMLFLNPCSGRVKKAILCGVREIIENYNIAGIHIDDYFYPTEDKSIDEDEYRAYIETGGGLTLEQFRRSNVSELVSSVYSAVKTFNEELVFSISPSADIDKNKNSLYADVELWCSESGYCDYIIPQIYFGFKNENLPFENTFSEWVKLTRSSNVRLIIGLAVYKSGCEDIYAGKSGANEWIENNDIIKRQIEYIETNDADGFSLFSFDYIFGNRNLTKEEVKNLKSVI